jgi:predicted negative regulator of RcsB-dependent stress response
MRLTSSFAVFRVEPGEKGLAKARWFAREGRIAEAEREYRAALDAEPDLRAGWLELFELLRRGGRHDDALGLATRSAQHFGPDAAMPLAMKGAALAELGRTREAIAALEAAIERDGNLALAWHELGYAAFKAGEHTRALLVLDRAFALEPHTDTLMLRGRILREAGQFDAAEVAFEGAQQSAEHDIPRRDAEREIAATRRGAALGRKKPRDFSERERVFAELGAVLLEAETSEPARGRISMADRLGVCIGAFAQLANALGWRPAVCAGVLPEDGPLAAELARLIGAQLVPLAALDPEDRPLIVTVYNGGTEEWSKQLARLERWRSGYAFALAQEPGVAETADVIGTLHCPGGAPTARGNLARALPLAGAVPAVGDEVTALAKSALARWRTRQSAGPIP